MITADKLIEIGKFGHPHGITGEISAVIDAEISPADLRCIVVNVDGIFVPFFITTVRPRSSTSLLLTIDGINNETEAAAFANRQIYALREECADLFDDDLADDSDGFYAEDLVGFSIHDVDGNLNGIISGVDDSTENVLFLVTDKSDNEIMIPVADEYIEDIDVDNKVVTVVLPEGFLDI